MAPTRSKQIQIKTEVPAEMKQILGDRPVADQVRSLQIMHAHAMTPVYCITILADPRPVGGVQVSLIGPEGVPIAMYRRALLDALNQVTELEVKSQAQAAAVPPSSPGS